jgi:nucleotide-binding universal stress UspA family protein
MINKILVPTDYSKASLNALEFAITVAASNNARLQILHVNDTIPGMQATTSTEEIKREIREAMAGNIQRQYGIKTEIIFTEGIVGHAIVKTVFENKIDLVIMGSHGAAGYRDFFIGSNSYYTIKRAACPVLLIPEENKWTEFCEILFPVRPNLFSLNLFDFIIDLIKHNTKKCMLQVFGIETNRNENGKSILSKEIQEAKKQYNKNKLDLSLSMGTSYDIPENVLLKAAHINADLIVISQGVDLASNPFFIGPLSQRIINHSKIPLLSLLRTTHN